MSPLTQLYPKLFLFLSRYIRILRSFQSAIILDVIKSYSALFLSSICPQTTPAVHNKFSNTTSANLITSMASNFKPRQFLQLHPESTCRWFSALFIYLRLTVATRRLGRKPWSWSGSVAHKPVVRRRPGFNPGLRHFTRHVYFLLFVLIFLLVFSSQPGD